MFKKEYSTEIGLAIETHKKNFNTVELQRITLHVINCGFHVRDYKTQPLNLTEERGRKKRAGKRRGEEPI